MQVIIDAGHGGYDPGGGTNEYFKEKDINLLISKYIYDRLKSLGVNAKLVRDKDETINPGKRIERINSFNPSINDILISNHVNNGGASGGEVIYSIRGNKTLPLLIAEVLKENNLAIRNVYTRKNKLGNDFYFIQRETIPNDAIIIEYGFADNEFDSNLIRFSWPSLAEAVVKAIATYLNIPYKPNNKKIYIVKDNDSLYKIGKKFNLTVEELKRINNLTTDEIYPEDILYLN